MPRTVTYQIQQYLLVQAIWGIFHSGVDVPSGFHIYSLADVLKVDIKLKITSHLPLITICSYNLSVRKSFVSLTEIIKMSKCQNSAWLCYFRDVPYLSLNKRLGFVLDSEVLVLSVLCFLLFGYIVIYCFALRTNCTHA